MQLVLMIMSGVEDGLRLSYSIDNGDGQFVEAQNRWQISIGRKEDSDLCLRNDSFISRQHAYIYWESERWWLEDCESTNGTFVEHADSDARVKGAIPIEVNQLFRVGHTWMRIEENNK
ncbi:MAG: FHA domain-containing protein [Chloroflexi bacterium]|nr:FHA domain-containing protein [Chloroflexota bacterium]MCC6892126.1 FHA domain-containing protein [Anaerolineae bacterium]